MKEYDCRIALRLPAEARQKAEKLIENGTFKNMSQVIREALREFLNPKEARSDAENAAE
ncbi:MAG: ribbon-helix-helix domain-containing protein [Candidatus Bathyarchaeota archaeon]|nr:ribbon-helix-helix domain-containing protein [Candidatus Bathyarchaeota archaeon]